MEPLSLVEFNQKVSDLQNLAEVTKLVVVTDINDKEQIEVVKKNKIALRDARNEVDRAGKTLREGAVTFQKEVIARVKELVDIIKPEEDRLDAILEEVKAKKLRAERLAMLPERKNLLASVGDGKDYSDKDELLLGMDNVEFQAYYNTCVANKNDADRRAIEERESAAKNEELRLQREAEMREREEKARAEERERAEREAKEKDARIEQERIDREAREAREKAEAIEREAKAKADAERAEAEAKAKLERADNYRAFRTSHGWTEETKGEFYELTDKENTKVVLYKKVGVFEL